MNGIGIGIGIDSGIGGGIPFKSDLQTWHKTITNDTFNESLVPFNAKILPSCGLFNGTNNYLYNATGDYLVGGEAFDRTIKFKTASKTGGRTILSYGGYSAALKGLTIFTVTTTGVLTVYTSDGTTQKTASFHTLQLNTYYELRIQWDGLTGGTITATLNGTALTSTESIAWSGNSGLALSVGCNRPQSTPLNYFSGRIYEIWNGSSLQFAFNGLGLYEYNLLSSNNLQWYGDARAKTFDASASRYCFTNGYKIYKKTGQLNEYVPTNGSDTVIAAAGYSLADYDTYAGSVDDWNMFPAMVDMNPTASADAKLAIFDRSNATRCSDLARVLVASGGTYIATTPFQWGISEITDPRIFTEYFNVGYAGRIAAKIETQLSGGNYYIKKYTEQLNYGTDKTGADQLKVMNYCKTNVFAL